MVMTKKKVHHFEFESDEIAKKISDKGFTTDLETDQAKNTEKKETEK